MYSHDEIEALTGKIRWMAVDLLGDRVATVKVEPRDRNDQISSAIRSPEGRRHAVYGMAAHAAPDPENWTRAACAALIAWLDKKAPPEQPGAS